mmetsp:Transcript_24667/g.38756  ORF Transcript_24667/g.38756 Transcript_24667/m.38756 type:complete len:247 (-) Transcript_24667:1137-1877(-)|eukprot:CAMPEP_0184292788 /NCGR_PEP_ID=MMETSP1049-20130417/4477_1 /TAXON_ID=77928 /ORGANISM="Proteomonas sulcata, Strain CCMP704" /LENGTH=246 /DNA_ID=CAMNT_0026600675 /DNA_START=405 /DNA_END=1145 /DNA_ORIENTATION=+
MTNILATIVPPTPQFHKGTPKEYLGSSAYSFFLTANLFAWLLGLITVIVQLALLWMYYKDLRDEEEAMEGMEVEENMTMLGKAVGIAYLILSVGPDLCAAAALVYQALHFDSLFGAGGQILTKLRLPKIGASRFGLIMASLSQSAVSAASFYVAYYYSEVRASGTDLAYISNIVIVLFIKRFDEALYSFFQRWSIDYIEKIFVGVDGFDESADTRDIEAGAAASPPQEAGTPGTSSGNGQKLYPTV